MPDSDVSIIPKVLLESLKEAIPDNDEQALICRELLDHIGSHSTEASQGLLQIQINGDLRGRIPALRGPYLLQQSPTDLQDITDATDLVVLKTTPAVLALASGHGCVDIFIELDLPMPLWRHGRQSAQLPTLNLYESIDLSYSSTLPPSSMRRTTSACVLLKDEHRSDSIYTIQPNGVGRIEVPWIHNIARFVTATEEQPLAEDELGTSYVSGLVNTTPLLSR